MLEILFWISAKKIVVTFALLGATVVTIAPKISEWAEPKENSDRNYTQNLLPQNPETVNETNETNGGGTYVVPETRTVSQRYESKEIINPINGEYQVACVPATTEASSQFDSLEACVESGKGGYLVNNTTNAVNFFGFNLLTDAYTSIPYCCQSYISKTTDELTKDNSSF